MQKEAETKNTVIEQKTENRERNNRKEGERATQGEASSVSNLFRNRK